MNLKAIPKRKYGKTLEELSIIGFGGIVVMNSEQDFANRIVAEAFEKGINYFDVAPSYGNAQEKLGPALEPYREKVFLACKTTERSAEKAKMEFEESLKVLRTDHFDLYQLHAITDVEKDVDSAFQKGGVMDFLISARKEGRVNYLGFSAHSIEAAQAAFDRFDFDSVLCPINFANIHKGNFGLQFIQIAQSKGAGVLALKAMAKQVWPEDDPEKDAFKKVWYQPMSDPRLASMALRYTLSQPITAAIPPGEESLFRIALETGLNYSPITEDELKELKNYAQELNPIFPLQS